jgi:glycosyltransferase involved in cell wall biosynthesis
MTPSGALHGQKVIFVLWTLELGGHHRQALLLARHLSRECGADVEIWGLTCPGDQATVRAPDGLPLRALEVDWRPSRLHRLQTLFRIGASLRASRPAVILPYTEVPNVACGVTWRMSGARLCIWNQRDLLTLGLLGPRTVQRAVKNTRSFVSNSTHAVGFMAKTYGIASDLVRVVPNGVRLDKPTESRKDLRRRLGLSEQATVALMTGALVASKDHVTLLKAWRQFTHETSKPLGEAVLLLAGSGGEEKRLKALAYDLELGRKVRFLGFVSDVPGLIEAADIGVLTSPAEGSPNAVLEYMAGGLPIVASDVAGIREASGPGGPVQLVPFGDAPSLALRLHELVEHPERRRALGEAGRRRISEAFSPERMCASMTSLIELQLAGKRP